MEVTAKKVKWKNTHHFVLLIPIVALLRLWQMTLRVRTTDTLDEIMATARAPMIILIWHNRLFSAPMVKRSFRRSGTFHALVSASRDGAWLEVLFRLIGARCVRGSANFRGAQSMREILRLLKANNVVGITPDGSKGPVYEVKAGAAALARLSGCPVILVGISHSASWRLRSWDRMFLPKPFSTVTFRAERIDSYEELGERDPHQAAEILQRRLRALNAGDD